MNRLPCVRPRRPQLVIVALTVVLSVECHRSEPLGSSPVFDVVSLGGGIAIVTEPVCSAEVEAKDGPHTLGSFEIDRSPITCSQYRACLARGACADVGSHAQCLQQAGMDLLWMSRVGAQQFCESRKMRLPTALQWQRAIRGVNGNLHAVDESRNSDRECENAAAHPSGRGCRRETREGVVYFDDTDVEMLRTLECVGRNAVSLVAAPSVSRLDNAIQRVSDDTLSGGRRVRCVREY